MEPSAYNPDLIQNAIRKLDLAGVDLTTDKTLTIRDLQTPGKWGFQPEPIAFRQAYSEILHELHDRISKVNEGAHALRDSLAGIQQDTNDADATSAAIANQIAANRQALDQPTTTTW